MSTPLPQTGTPAPGVPLSVWLAATRPQFLTAIALPVLLGTVIAWHETGAFDALRFALALCAGLLAHAGANVLNDYFDHRSGADELNRSPITPFAGGSRMIQRGLLSPAQTRRYGLLLLAGATALGLLLVWLTSPLLFWLGLLGVALGYAYSGPPLALNYRGLGEWVVALDFGVLAVLGAYYVQTGTLGTAALLASLPVALLVAAILFVNEFPDHESDAAAGKRTLVVLLGPRRAWPLLPALLGGALALIVLGWGLGLLPATTLLALLAAPLAILASLVASRAHSSPQHMLPAMKAVIAQHAAVSLLLTLGYCLA